MRKVVFLAGLLALSACNAPFNPHLLPGSLAGTWSGSLSSAGMNVATLEMSLTPGPDAESGGPGQLEVWTVNGHWAMTPPSVANGGTASGRGTGPTQLMHFDLQGTNGCAIALAGLQFGGSSIMGTYTASLCSVPDSGAFKITKQ